jgi:molybdopterin synthase sulfur carrier subunit
VRVKFFAYIRDFTGCKETDFPFHDTVGKLARALCDHYGKKLRDKMLNAAGDDFGPDIIVLINGRHVAHLGGFNAPLKEDDTVFVFPMVAGG